MNKYSSYFNGDTRMLASELIKNECCGVCLLSAEKAELVNKVENLENEKVFLENQLNNALVEIKRLNSK